MNSEAASPPIPRFLPALLILLLVLVPAFFLVVHGTSPQTYPEGTLVERYGDYANIALDVQHAHAGRLLSGPYSRFTFYHPSPFFAYWYAAFESLGIFGTGYPAYEAAQAIWNLLCLSCALVGVWILTQSALCVTLLAALSQFLFQAAHPRWLFDIWGPVTTMGSSLALVVSAACVLNGHLVFFAWTSVFAGVAVASHIGGLPLSGGIWLLTALSFLRQGGIRAFPKTLGTAFIALLLIIAPPIYEMLISPNHSTWHRLLRFLHSKREFLGFGGALDYLQGYLLSVFGVLGPALGIILVFGCLYLAVRASGAVRHSAVVCSIGLLLSLVATARIIVPATYYLQWQFWAVVTFAVTGFAARTLPLIKRSRAGALGLMSILLVAYCSLSASVSHAPAFPFTPSAPIAFLDSLPTPVEIRPGSRKEWDAAAMLLKAAALQDPKSLEGKLCVPRPWLFMFRWQMACKTAPQSAVNVWRSFAAPVDLGAEAVRSDMLTVLRVDPTSPVPGMGKSKKKKR